MDSRTRMKPRLLHVVALAATAMLASPQVLGAGLEHQHGEAGHQQRRAARREENRLGRYGETTAPWRACRAPTSRVGLTLACRADYLTRGRCGPPPVRQRWRRCAAPNEVC